MTNPYDPASPRDKTTMITETLARRDNAALLALLADDGSDGSWCDDRGQTLLHFAAMRGDEALCDALIYKKGFSVQARNEEGDTPARTAAIFGHERLAQQLADIERRQHSATPVEMPPVTTLAELRQRKVPSGLNAFYDYACAGRFDMVVAAALASGEHLTREDLLVQGQKGESVALRLCQSGQLAVLLRADLWRTPAALDVLRHVRATLPVVYRQQIDAAGITGPSAPAAGADTAPAGRAVPPSPRRFKLGPK